MKTFLLVVTLIASVTTFAGDTSFCHFDMVKVSELENYAKVRNANLNGMTMTEAYSEFKYELLKGGSYGTEGIVQTHISKKKLCINAASACLQTVIESNEDLTCIFRGIQSLSDQVQ